MIWEPIGGPKESLVHIANKKNMGHFNLLPAISVY